MNPAEALCAAGAILLLSTAAHAQALGPREELILRTLDANGDQLISCAELAAYLNPRIATALREMGIEPGMTSKVPACGPRQGAGPAPEDKDGRAPDENYAEYFRGLIQGALGAAGSDPGTPDAIAPIEIVELEAKSVSAPLTGTLSDLLPQSQEVPPAAGKKMWTDILEQWVNIRQSFLDEQGIAKPARISYTKTAADDETLAEGAARRVYAIKSAIVLTPPFTFIRTARLEVLPVAAFEANITSDTPARDLIVHRVGLSSLIIRKDSTAPFSSHTIDLTFDYSTNRGYKAEVYGATLQYTPQYRDIGIGQYVRKGASVDLRWRPYVGVVWIDVKQTDVVKAYQERSSFSHEYMKLAGELKLGDRVKVTPELTLWHGDRTLTDDEVDRWQSYRTLEGRIVLSQAKGVDRASLTLTWTRGRNSPGFEYERAAVLALAAKF